MVLNASLSGNFRFTFFIVALAILFAGCTGKKAAKRDFYFDIDEEDPKSKEFPVYHIGQDKGATLAAKDHLIKQGDRIYIRFLNNFSLEEGMTIANTTTEMAFVVDNDGKVSLPIVGRVKIEGLNKRETARKLEQMYSAYMVNPLLEVIVLGRTVDVWGEVRAPGIYDLGSERVTLVDVLAKAGGITQYGIRDQIRLIRTLPDGSKELQIFDFTKFGTLELEELYVQDRDIIVVEPKKIKIFLDQIQPYTAAITLITTVSTFGILIWQSFRSTNP